MKFFTLLLSMLIVTQSFAQDARYNYGPITGVNLDDMLAIASKTYENKEVKTGQKSVRFSQWVG